jgi:uncharacterized protein (UPF0128 family)
MEDKVRYVIECMENGYDGSQIEYAFNEVLLELGADTSLYARLSFEAKTAYTLMLILRHVETKG